MKHPQSNLLGVTLVATFVFLAGAAGIAVSAETPKLHPLDAYCVTSEMKGMMTGSWVECSRKYGYERYEIQNTKIKMGPITQTDNKRVLYVGDKIYTIPENGPATVAENPMFEGTVEALEDSDPMALSEQMLQGMGFTPNGETMEIVGIPCNVASGQMGRICMTPKGLVLYMNTMGQEREAVAVDLESGGEDKYYAVPENVQEAPDMSKIQDMMKGLGLGQD